MEEIGRSVIRDHMPDQHREFYAQLPFIVVGSVDNRDWPWASMLQGNSGFVQSPDPRTLQIQAKPLPGDPMIEGIAPGSRLGLLGIELPTRRRNRVNVRVTDSTDSGLSLAVDQSFGNCPQYIQRRSIDFVQQGESLNDSTTVKPLTRLDNSARRLIASADTLFVASYIATVEGGAVEGVDVSHRGGKAGFVRVEDNTLTIPDYSGNNFFNTLGNLAVNPKAGLLFPDFDSGDVLLLTGRAEILWEDDPQVRAFHGAERAWQFTLDHGVRIEGALRFRGVFEDYANTSLATGDWEQAEATLAGEKQRDTWQRFRVADITDESTVIRSFTLVPASNATPLPFEAGQFLTLRVTPPGTDSPVCRTYTVSSAPNDEHYRLSVKREPDGLVSNHLHDSLQAGDEVEIKAPRGNFTLDTSHSRPLVLLAGGVGITPMMSMAQDIANRTAATGQRREVTIFHSAQDSQQRAFADDFRRLAKNSDGAIRYFSYIDRALPGDREGIDYDGTGYITADDLRRALPLDDYDFYLCGPPAFMQSIYNLLRELGVRDLRIHAEAFGPAALTRQPDEATAAAPQPGEASLATIDFSTSGIQTSWSRGGPSILEVAEAQGLTPDYGCRNGTCGTCATRVKQGGVRYRSTPSASVADGEVLICCAVPAQGDERLVLEL
jgi:ferredoxin-NADP reductase/predicted pyridoxine 5'-phosphate oxidase superfamily flavin-nucleotide-binding protein